MPSIYYSVGLVPVSNTHLIGFLSCLQKLTRPPTPQEIAKHLQQPVSRVVLCMRKTQSPINMDAQPSDNERDSMIDLLASSMDDDSGSTSMNSVMHS